MNSVTKKVLLLTILFNGIITMLDANNLIINVRNRKTISLDGKWNIIVDRYGNGYFDSYLRAKKNGYFLNNKPATPGDRIEYDFDSSPIVNVPGDWNSQIPELLYYEGLVWYKKSFVYKKVNHTRTFIHFGAVNYHAKIYLNGEKIGEHTGGFTPFQFEITDKVNNGENVIIVLVDNMRTKEGIPTLKTDWWNYGGITRSVKLIETPENFVQDYCIQLKKGEPQVIEGWFQTNGVDKSINITLDIPELGITENSKTNKKGYATFRINANPELWSPENPKLYNVNISSPEESFSDKIGFRTIETKGAEIILNSKPVYLRGICLHEEAPFRAGRAYNDADARTLLTWAKELGCNFVRLAHYPHGEYMTRMADEMGLMVWSEIPVYWAIDWKNEETLSNAMQQLADNITRDKNRASVIIWSVANETPKIEERTVFLKALINKAREMDNTRLISAALHHTFFNKKLRGMNDPLGKELDVIGFNEYLGWYGADLPDSIADVKWDMQHNKPYIISEFGGGALQGYHGKKEQRWTEEYQEWLYEENIKMIENIDKIAGTTPWILMDFRSPNRVLPNIQDGWNRKGLISDQGIKKKAFYIMQQWYNKKTLKK